MLYDFMLAQPLSEDGARKIDLFSDRGQRVRHQLIAYGGAGIIVLQFGV